MLRSVHFLQKRFFQGQRRQISPHFSISENVQNSLAENKPIVALESTVITHGLPFPKNLEVAQSLEKIILENRCTPATIALMNGKICVGLDSKQLEMLAEPNNSAVKASLRDLPNILAEKKFGGTTVAATMWAAHQAGIQIFSTGGIGGVHRGAEYSFDISADLTELGRIPVAVVSAGVKSILDIPKTLQLLETNSVNVIVYDEKKNFPGFFVPRTEHLAPFNTTSLTQLAQILHTNAEIGLKSGTLIACPLPEHLCKDADGIENAIQEALRDIETKNIQHKEVTPYILQRVNELTGSKSLDLNVGLLKNNAQIASKLAVEYSKLNVERDKKNVETFSIKYSKESIPAKNAKNETKKPNVLCVGAAILDFEVNTLETYNKNDGAYHPGTLVYRAGGVARNHADALTRLGINSPLLSVTGGDNNLADLLRQNCEHMNWHYVKSLSNFSTPTSMSILENGVLTNGFLNLEIVKQLTPKMILEHEHLFVDADYVIVDANLSPESLAQVIKIATKNLTPDDFFDNAQVLADYLLSSKYRDLLYGKIFAGDLQYLLITVDRGGVLLLSKEHGKLDIEIINAPKLKSKEELVSVSGAGDCFNAGFLASKLHQIDTYLSLDFASKCAMESLRSTNAVPPALADLKALFKS